MADSTLVLDPLAASRKLDRIAHEILEHYDSCEDVVLLGIGENGSKMARELANRMDSFIQSPPKVGTIKLEKHGSFSSSPTLVNAPDVTGKQVIVVDDVLNSGRTLIHAVGYILTFEPKEVRTMVLVDRRHRKFPIRADFVGLTLSTTIEEHIHVAFDGSGISASLI